MAERVTPMIHVPDVSATVSWYISIGFTLDGTYEDDGETNWASVSLGDSRVMFNAGGTPSTAERREVDLYINTDGVDDIYARLNGRVEVVSAPYDAFHGMHEFIIRDLNRFWIVFGEPLKP
jgi:hypothetical protein